MYVHVHASARIDSIYLQATLEISIFVGEKNQINCKNGKAFSSSPKNKIVSTFQKEHVRSTLTAGNSLTSCLSTAVSALSIN